MTNDKLYYVIDDDDEMSDAEKRETYFAEKDNEEAEEDWQNKH